MMDKQSALHQLKGYDEAKAREEAEAVMLGQGGGSSQRSAPSDAGPPDHQMKVKRLRKKTIGQKAKARRMSKAWRAAWRPS